MPVPTPRNLLAILLRRMTTGFRSLRSDLARLYVTLAYPEITLGRGVFLYAGAQLRAHDGGTMMIGAGTSIGRGVVLVADGAKLEIGARGFIGEGSTIVAKAGICIGVDSLIAERVSIRDQDHAIHAFPRNRELLRAVPIKIGDNVWIGAKGSVLKGVTIGDHCVVGAHAVVTRDLPVGSIASGIPAVVRGNVDDRSDASPRGLSSHGQDGPA